LITQYNDAPVSASAQIKDRIPAYIRTAVVVERANMRL
jgi:hypothetical protein